MTRSPPPNSPAARRDSRRHFFANFNRASRGGCHHPPRECLRKRGWTKRGEKSPLAGILSLAQTDVTNQPTEAQTTKHKSPCGLVPGKRFPRGKGPRCARQGAVSTAVVLMRRAPVAHPVPGPRHQSGIPPRAALDAGVEGTCLPRMWCPRSRVEIYHEPDVWWVKPVLGCRGWGGCQGIVERMLWLGRGGGGG